jgi:hypothetical protein
MDRNDRRRKTMSYIVSTGLVLAASAALGMSVVHQDQVDHHTGPVAVEYRADIAITHKQVGAVAPAGIASSLRCDWAATMAVERQAVAASGTRLVRTIDSGPVVSGTRPGWCGTSRRAISREVSGKAADMKSHLVVLAQEDKETLRAELDRVHGEQRAG